MHYPKVNVLSNIICSVNIVYWPRETTVPVASTNTDPGEVFSLGIPSAIWIWLISKTSNWQAHMLSLATSLTSHACLNVERRRENLDHIPMGSPPSDRPSWASLYASASQRFIEEVASISFSVKLGNFVKFATFDNAWKWKSEPVCRPHQVRASSATFPQIGSHWKKVQPQLVSSFRSDQA